MLDEKEVARYERELQAMLRRAGDEDPEGFAAIHQLLTRAASQLPTAAALCREQHSYSWTELGRALGVTRQSAQQQLGKAIPEGVADVATELKGRIRRVVRYTGPKVAAQ